MNNHIKYLSANSKHYPAIMNHISRGSLFMLEKLGVRIPGKLSVFSNVVVFGHNKLHSPKSTINLCNFANVVAFGYNKLWQPLAKAT